VRREAAAGRKKGTLVPVRLDAAPIPAEFADIQAADLSLWEGKAHLTEVQALLRRLAGLVPPSRVDTVRPGYDAAFLGEKRRVALPAVKGSAAVLRYLHFTVVMNPGRKLAHYTAYNMDGTRFVDVPREDSWAADPLLPTSLQIDMPLLRRTEFDRGHLMSRANVSWGEEREASIATRQAFFWTNIAPQHRRLNQQWWLALEEWERRAAVKCGRATGFSGPIFSGEDETFGGQVTLEDGLVAYDTFRMPRAYWKVVVTAAPRGKLALAACLMNQFAMLESGVGKRIDIGDYRVTLKHLEEVAGLRFDASLHGAAALNVE